MSILSLPVVCLVHIADFAVGDEVAYYPERITLFLVSKLWHKVGYQIMKKRFPPLKILHHAILYGLEQQFAAMGESMQLADNSALQHDIFNLLVSPDRLVVSQFKPSLSTLVFRKKKGPPQPYPPRDMNKNLRMFESILDCNSKRKTVLKQLNLHLKDAVYQVLSTNNLPLLERFIDVIGFQYLYETFRKLIGRDRVERPTRAEYVREISPQIFLWFEDKIILSVSREAMEIESDDEVEDTDSDFSDVEGITYAREEESSKNQVAAVDKCIARSGIIGTIQEFHGIFLTKGNAAVIETILKSDRVINVIILESCMEYAVNSSMLGIVKLILSMPVGNEILSKLGPRKYLVERRYADDDLAFSQMCEYLLTDSRFNISPAMLREIVKLKRPEASDLFKQFIMDPRIYPHCIRYTCQKHMMKDIIANGHIGILDYILDSHGKELSFDLDSTCVISECCREVSIRSPLTPEAIRGVVHATRYLVKEEVDLVLKTSSDADLIRKLAAITNANIMQIIREEMKDGVNATKLESLISVSEDVDLAKVIECMENEYEIIALYRKLKQHVKRRKLNQ